MGHPEQSGPELCHGASVLAMDSAFVTETDRGIGMARRLPEAYRSSFARMHSDTRHPTAVPKAALERLVGTNCITRRRSRKPFHFINSRTS
jgi:hypothetical protein